jgi:hypothetical protein
MTRSARLSRRLSGARPRRGLLITCLVVGCVGLGAALGAGTHAASSTFRAQSELTVAASSAALQPVAWHTISQVLELSGPRRQIAHLSGIEASGLRLGTSGDPQSSLITVYGDARTAAQAELLVNSASSVAVEFLRRTFEGSSVSRSSFDHSTEGWDVGSGIYTLPPGRIAIATPPAHSGIGSLQATCDTLVVGGCGPYLRLERAFHRATPYLATGWVKVQPSTRIRMVLGATPEDVAVGPVAAGGPGWRHLSVLWTPQHETSLAVAAFQVMSLGHSTSYVDDVQVGPRASVGRAPQAAVRAAHYETIIPASSAEAREDDHTAVWAAGGAGAGLLMAFGAIAAAGAAGRIRDRRLAADRETPL